MQLAPNHMKFREIKLLVMMVLKYVHNSMTILPQKVNSPSPEYRLTWVTHLLTNGMWPQWGEKRHYNVHLALSLLGHRPSEFWANNIHKPGYPKATILERSCGRTIWKYREMCEQPQLFVPQPRGQTCEWLTLQVIPAPPAFESLHLSSSGHRWAVPAEPCTDGR